MAALAGGAFAILLFFGVVSLNALRDATDAELLEWWSDSGHQRASLISAYLFLLSSPLFLVFVCELCNHIRPASPGTQRLPGFVFAAGIISSALLALAGVTRGLVAQSILTTDEPIPGPDTIRFATALSQVIFGSAAVPFAAITIGAASAVILRTGAMWRWLGWFGIAASVITIAVTAATLRPFTLPLVLLWTLAASFALWRTRTSVVDEVQVELPSPATTHPAGAAR